MAVRMLVKDIVDKHASMKQKADEVFSALRQLHGKNYHDTELLDHAVKDKRYAVQLLVQEYDRLIADMTDLEMTEITLHED